MARRLRMTSAEYARANTEREHAGTDHTIVAVRETFNNLPKP